MAVGEEEPHGVQVVENAVHGGDLSNLGRASCPGAIRNPGCDEGVEGGTALGGSTGPEGFGRGLGGA